MYSALAMVVMIHVNVAEEAVTKGLLLFPLLFTTAVLQQDHGVATTSCFGVSCGCQSCYR